MSSTRIRGRRSAAAEPDLGEEGLVPLPVVLLVALESFPKVLLAEGALAGAMLAGAVLVKAWLAGVVLVRVAGVGFALLVVVVLVGALGDEVADLSTLEAFGPLAPLLAHPVVIGALKATRHQTKLIIPKRH